MNYKQKKHKIKTLVSRVDNNENKLFIKDNKNKVINLPKKIFKYPVTIYDSGWVESISGLTGKSSIYGDTVYKKFSIDNEIETTIPDTLFPFINVSIQTKTHDTEKALINSPVYYTHGVSFLDHGTIKDSYGSILFQGMLSSETQSRLFSESFPTLDPYFKYPGKVWNCQLTSGAGGGIYEVKKIEIIISSTNPKEKYIYQRPGELCCKEEINSISISTIDMDCVKYWSSWNSFIEEWEDFSASVNYNGGWGISGNQIQFTNYNYASITDCLSFSLKGYVAYYSEYLLQKIRYAVYGGIGGVEEGEFFKIRLGRLYNVASDFFNTFPNLKYRYFYRNYYKKFVNQHTNTQPSYITNSKQCWFKLRDNVYKLRIDGNIIKKGTAEAPDIIKQLPVYNGDKYWWEDTEPTTSTLTYDDFPYYSFAFPLQQRILITYNSIQNNNEIRKYTK